MAGGRPTKLTQETLEKTREYIAVCTENKKLPTIEGLAFNLDVNKTSIYEWRKWDRAKTDDEDEETYNNLCQLHTEFSNLIEWMLNKQADDLVNKGLNNEYNPTITKVLLTKHGYREGVETDFTSKGESVNLNAETLALAKEYEEKLKQMKS